MQPLGIGSHWRETLTSPFRGEPELSTMVRADVAILGAGITGLTAAWQLKQAGRKVVVLEAGEIGHGTTGGTSAHLDAFPDFGPSVIVDNFGEKAARQITRSRLSAIDAIERLCGELGLAAHFARVPAYYYTEDSKTIEDIRTEQNAAVQVGLEVQPIDKVPLPFPTANGFRIANQGRFHSLEYLHGLARAVHGDGCTIYEQTFAQPPKEGAPCTVKTSKGEVVAENVIIATHSAFLGISLLDTLVAPYMSYVLSCRVKEAVEDALFWDNAEPYHYIRLVDGDPHRLIVGGADHKVGQSDDERTHFGALEEYVRERFTVEAIEHRWCAEFFEPSDGVPYIGMVPFGQHVYVATGYSGSGLTWGTAAGMLLADLILGRENSLADIVSPTRIKPIASAKEFVSENLNVAVHWATDRTKGEKIGWIEEVPAGQGALVQLDGKQLAVYREPDGRLHALSPKCTHAGCTVQWNPAEQTWDCPCHGGRFTATGQRLYGPPAKDLDPEEVPT